MTNQIQRNSLQTPASVRLACRSGEFCEQTSGLAPGYAQANLVVLPQADAEQFLGFCRANPKPCPLLEVTQPGDPTLATICTETDIRTDLPRYRVWENGELIDEPQNILTQWRDDLVSFLIGCSFSFDAALLEAGLPVRHVDLGRNVPMFRTNIRCVSSGKFSGPLVVSMRPMKPAEAIEAVQITARFPQVHGAPVHIGLPDQIGISDLQSPDYGDSVPMGEDELPVFWACGVTPQAAIAEAKPEFVITHSPGCMFVTDVTDRDLLAGKLQSSSDED
jgi:uncharacterized protein YcsI (UPF0317 family)